MVGLPEQHARGHVAGNEREVRPVVAVEDLFRPGRTDGRHQGIIVVRMAAEEEGGRLVNVLLADDVREMADGVADGRSEAHHLPAAGPVAQADGHAIRIL